MSLQIWAWYLCTLQEWWFPCIIVFRWVGNIQTYWFWHFRLIRSSLRTCTGGKYRKCMVIFRAPAFLGVVCTCTCSWYQAAFFPHPPVAWVRGYTHTILLWLVSIPQKLSISAKWALPTNPRKFPTIDPYWFFSLYTMYSIVLAKLLVLVTYPVFFSWCWKNYNIGATTT